MDQLTGLRRADAAIVGGGLTGLLLAASLSQAGMRVGVVEAGDGTDGPSAAPATVDCGPVYARIHAAHGPEAAQQYAAGLQSQLHALTETPLPYVRPTAVYTYAATGAELPALAARRELLTSLHLPVQTAPDAGGCPFPVELSLVSQGQALVDIPRWKALLMRSIRRQGGRIFLRSRVISLEPQRICTAHGCLHAPLIVLTTGKPLGLLDKPLLALLESRRVLRCHVEGGFPLHHIQQSVAEGGLTLCPAGGGSIASWEAGRVGTRPPPTDPLALRLPDWRHGDCAVTQEVFPADGLPVLGALTGLRMLCASGLGGCAVLGAMHAASLLTRRILGRALPEDALYAPDRPVPGRILRPEIRRLSILRAGFLLRPGAPSCSHCGFRMRYTARWECPGCGSVYTMLGQVLCGPGLRDARVSARQRPVE